MAKSPLRRSGFGALPDHVRDGGRSVQRRVHVHRQRIFGFARLGHPADVARIVPGLKISSVAVLRPNTSSQVPDVLKPAASHTWRNSGIRVSLCCWR